MSSLFLLLLLTVLWAGEARFTGQDKPYLIYNLEKTCPPYKKEIKLGNSAAIFYLDESDPITRGVLSRHDLNCHLELENDSSSVYGFHVFIDEMVLDDAGSTQSVSSVQHCPNDYVQYGRDRLYVTTRMSPRCVDTTGLFFFLHIFCALILSKWQMITFSLTLSHALAKAMKRHRIFARS